MRIFYTLLSCVVLLELGACQIPHPPKDDDGMSWAAEPAPKPTNGSIYQSGREVALASVYAALERLESKGFVASALGEPTAERGGRARTYFKPTAAGVREAREAHDTLQRLSIGLASLKGETA